jgi:hypothetical protein
MAHRVRMNTQLTEVPRMYAVGVNGFMFVIDQLDFMASVFMPWLLDNSVQP